MARPRAIEERPEGLVHRPELLSEDEERELLRRFDGLDFREIRMHGVVAKRTARHYGLDYDYDSRGIVEEVEPIPDWLLGVREQAAALAGIASDDLVEALVQRYPEGSQIGWHRDAPAFGTVVGVSLGSSARLRFRRETGGVRRAWEVELEPRSGYVLAGEARTAWQHHVPPTKALRFSITFRTLRTRVARLPEMAKRRSPTHRGARRMGERERTTGIDPDDAAAQWLREHDAVPAPEPSKSSRKSVELHRFRKRQGTS